MDITNISTSFGSFTNLIKQNPKISQNSSMSLKSIFDKADKNEDGKLDSTEINTLLKAWNIDPSFDSETILNEVDKNGDGGVSFDEIKEYVENNLDIGNLDGNMSLGSVLNKIPGLGNIGNGLKSAVESLLNPLKDSDDNPTAQN